MTPGGVGWDPSSVPRLPGALLAWSSTNPLPSYSLSLNPEIHQSVGRNVFKSRASTHQNTFPNNKQRV